MLVLSYLSTPLASLTTPKEAGVRSDQAQYPGLSIPRFGRHGHQKVRGFSLISSDGMDLS